MMERWRDLFTTIGESFLELMAAELAELEGDLGRSGKLLVRIVVAFVLAAVLAVYATGGAGALAVVLLSRVWPLWGAILAVIAALLLLASVAAAVGAVWLRRLESPLATVRRRMDSHVEWWQGEILDGDELGRGPERTEGGGATAGEAR
jgi:hypothetical protein